MSAVSASLLFVLACYLIGGLPSGLLIGRLRGIDIREHGSRNIGATNVGRVLGRKLGLVVFFLDVGKGLLPIAFYGWHVRQQSQQLTVWEYAVWVLAASACVLGHVYPVYLRFRGGKGVATILGVTLGIYPNLTIAGLACFGVWAIVAMVTRYTSLGSICAMIAFPIAHYVALRPVQFDRHWPVILYSFILPAIVIYRHRTNIGRLLAGTEPRIGASRPTC